MINYQNQFIFPKTYNLELVISNVFCPLYSKDNIERLHLKNATKHIKLYLTVDVYQYYSRDELCQKIQIGHSFYNQLLE